MTGTGRQGPVPLDRTVFLRPIAHRGLHDPSRGIVENTLPAFQAAIARGIGIECDLRSSRSGEPVVFHDATLDRMTDRAGPVLSLSPEALQRVPIRDCGAASTIPSFAALLSLVAGRVPLLVEVKSDWAAPEPRFVAAIARLAQAYAGPIALMSFDTAMVAALAAAAPAVPRGLVAGSSRATGGPPWRADGRDARRRTEPEAHSGSLDAILDGFEDAGASFIACEAGALPASARVAMLRSAGCPVFAWTIRSPGEWEAVRRHADAPIFEGAPPPS